MIIVDVKGGLCDRMQVLDSAFGLARDLNRPVCVPWLINSGLGARFDQLFEVNKLTHEFRYFNHPDHVQEFISSRSPSIVFRRTFPWSWESTIEFRDQFQDLEKLRSHQVIVVRSYERFYANKEQFSDFIPKSHLQTKIADIVAKFGNTVGVHIRRTDNAAAARDSRTEHFLKMMDNISNEVDNFFVATDDPHEEAFLRDRFRVVTHQKRSLDRSTVEALEDAAIDLYCLAATRQLIGSHGSSFTHVAAQLYGIPLRKAGYRHHLTWAGF